MKESYKMLIDTTNSYMTTTNGVEYREAVEKVVRSHSAMDVVYGAIHSQARQILARLGILGEEDEMTDPQVQHYYRQIFNDLKRSMF